MTKDKSKRGEEDADLVQLQGVFRDSRFEKNVVKTKLCFPCPTLALLEKASLS